MSMRSKSTRSAPPRKIRAVRRTSIIIYNIYMENRRCIVHVGLRCARPNEKSQMYHPCGARFARPTSVDAGASLGASLRELASEAAAVCTASMQHTGDG